MEIANLFVSAAADPLMDAAIEASTITLSGTACEDFICGGISGQVVKPVDLPLSAELSKFAMERVEEGEDYPEPPQINCLGDLAKPVTDL